GWSDDLLRGLTGFEDAEVMAKTAEAFGGYCEYAMRLAEERRANPTDDLMSILVHAEVEGKRLDADSVIAESLLILIGGDETTRHVISGGLYQLLVDRSRWEALRADRSLLPSAIEEMLRWVTPIKNMNRTVTEDVTFQGVDLHAGDKMLLLYPSANRDESVFTDPFSFDIRRHPNDHVAFGGYGTHHCLGKSLARLELQVMFETLLDRLPDLDLTEASEPAYRAANFVSGYESMPVRITPSAPVGAA
ncbi:MAG: cytochrome P450, partial [Actinobacteria bacterium]|nr:cytochrome P450 [Actinomycetota bacterium]